MAEPTKKDESIEQFLTQTFGHDRRATIRQNTCIPAPLGCGGPAVEFRDVISQKEYTISGLCQSCQDSVFSSDEEDEL